MQKIKPPKEWTFTVTIREGNDEFWEDRPTKKVIAEEVRATLWVNGFHDCKVK